MKLIQNMVNMKINVITAEELMKYSGQFNISLTKKQAEKIAAYLRGKNFDVFNDESRAQLIKQIARMTSPETAREINKLFVMLTK